MKELSIEEKAKRYDEAIKKLRDFYRDYDTVSCLINVKEELANLFPELAESEDEKIRKRLAEYFEGYYDRFATDRNHVNVHWEGLEVKEILAWLEKQSKDSPVLSNSSNTGKSSWSEEDVAMLDSAIAFVEHSPFTTIGKGKNNVIAWLKSIRDKAQPQPQPRQEWSEEDESMLQNILECLKNGWRKLPTDILKYESWLKSLRPQNMWISVDKEVYINEPVLAQKKDKSDQFGGFVVCCDHTLTPNVYERYMILGDIVHQNRWKPSDEQMVALYEETQKSNRIKDDRIVSLYNDLKKLREE